MKKLFLPLFFLLFLAFVSSAGAWNPMAVGGNQTSSAAAPTYFASASNCADECSENGASPVAVTPPGSMQQYDLVVIVGKYRGNGAITVSNNGGQSWTDLGEQRDAALTLQVFYCTYDGTWDANPSFAFAATTNGTTVTMHVFRPGSTPHTWATDVALASNTYSAPGSPYDVTITGITTQTNNAIVMFAWGSGDDNEWALQTGGWSNPTNTQWRNTGGSDSSVSIGYLIKETAGATGNSTNRQTTIGGDAGAYVTFAIK